jgi:hypothetical protein
VRLENKEDTYNLVNINPLNAEFNPIRHLLALAGAHHLVDVSRIRFKWDKKAVCIVTQPTNEQRSFIT